MTSPAFPCAPIAVEEGLPSLTKREYAAIHIAAGLVMRGMTFHGEPSIAARSVALADAVLREAGE